MPTIQMGNTEFRESNYRPKQTIDYDYPEDFDLKPGSPFHTKLRNLILERAHNSARVMSGRHSDWAKIDETLTAYIPTSELEEDIKYEDSRKPTSIVFPNSYTILETLLSYFVGAFIQGPIFQYEGAGPKDVIGAILLEKIIDLQCNKNKVGLNLHTQARDSFAYGFGISTPTWVQEYGTKTIKEMTGGFLGFNQKPTYTYIPNYLMFEGNALDNIDPYLYLPDPSVPVHSPQEGEYVGWVARSNYMNLLSQERNSDEIFNVKYLRPLLGRTSSVYPSDNSGRNTKSGMSVADGAQDKNNKTIDIIKMFIDIIPKEYNLGDSEYPEKWYFELAQDEVIIVCRPTNLDHGQFPVTIMAPDFDGYSMTPISRIEMMYGMQGVLDFMFNSHVQAVRQSINNTLIYDPYLINSVDLQNRGEGGLVRYRRPAWGKDIKNGAVHQLNINDTTRGNVNDAGFIVNWMERISGADASMQGALRQGGPERLTGAEYQGTRAGGVTRLERMVKVMGMQGMQDIGKFFALHNKQLMSHPQWVKFAGDWEEVLLAEYGQGDRGRLKVKPEEVDVNFNVIVRDGSVPGGNYAQIWNQLFQTVTSNEQLAQNFDVVRIFTHIARNLGAKNVNEFIKKGGNIQPKVMPDEQVQQQVQQGNLVAI